MAVHDNTEFGQLFAAFVNGDLTEEERARLHELAGQDVGRRGALAEVEAVHELVAVETDMRSQCMQPVEPAEEADESYRRLARAAARAEEKLRAHLMHPTTIQATAGVGAVGGEADRGSRRWLYLAAAAVLLIGAAVGILANTEWGRAPGLDGNRPDERYLDGTVIDVTTVITDDSPELAWSDLRARSYDARILDANGRVVLQRAASAKRFTNWQLSDKHLTTLRGHQGKLFLEVVARDKAGVEMARTARPELIEVK